MGLGILEDRKLQNVPGMRLEDQCPTEYTQTTDRTHQGLPLSMTSIL